MKIKKSFPTRFTVCRNVVNILCLTLRTCVRLKHIFAIALRI